MRVLLSAWCCLVLLLATTGCASESSEPASARSAAAAGTTDAPRRAFFHENRPYRLQNSLRGLQLAVARGYEWIDIDSNHCWDDGRRRHVALATHWARIRGDHFQDPEGRIPTDAKWADLTLAEARRLVTDDAEPYRVLTMVEIVRAAARVGLTGIEWEVKSGAGFEHPAVYRPVLAAADRVGLAIVVKTLRNVGGEAAALRRLAAAKEAGATTMLLNHDDDAVRIDADRASYVDYVRGDWVDAT